MKKYTMVLDTETCNLIDCPFVYDIGFVIVDKNGTVYEKVSLVIEDFYKNDLMKSAYYIDKLPQYEEDIANGTRKVVSLAKAKTIVRKTIEKYDIEDIVAHNARFDYLSLNNSIRYRNCSKYRYFLPNYVNIVDTLKLAKLVLNKNEDYCNYCKKNNYITKNNQNKLTAEIIYRYITNNNNFIEKHTGLEDTLIEKEILAYCLKYVDIENGILYEKRVR